MKKIFVMTVVVVSAFVVPKLVHAAYDVNQVTQLPGQVLNTTGQVESTLGQFTGLRLSDVLAAAGVDSANQKVCQAKNVLGQLDSILSNLRGFIFGQINGLINDMLQAAIKQLAACALSNVKIFGWSPPVPQCTWSVASDTATTILMQHEQDLKANFIGRCGAAATLNDMFAMADQVLNDQGPNGGTVAVTNWVNNLYTEPDRQGMRRMWTILVNTDICPYFRTQALDYFGVPQAYRDNPPSVSSTDLNTTADDPFQLRGACTLPKDYIPGSEENADAFTANGGFSYLAELAKPQNTLAGFIDIGEAELRRQRTVSVQAAVNEAVSGGGFRSVYGSGTEGCKVLDPTTGQCIEFAAVRQPPAAAAQINEVKTVAPWQWVVNQNGTTNKAVQDMAAIFGNHILNMANRPLPFRIKFGFEDSPANFTPIPTPSTTPVPPQCANIDPGCTCVVNDPSFQGGITAGISAAMTQLMAQQQSLFNPPGSSIIATGVTQRQVTQALCDVMNAGQPTAACIPHPSIDNEIVIIGAGQTVSFDVITPDGALRTNGGIAILACEPGIQN